MAKWGGQGNGLPDLDVDAGQTLIGDDETVLALHLHGIRCDGDYGAFKKRRDAVGPCDGTAIGVRKGPVVLWAARMARKGCALDDAIHGGQGQCIAGGAFDKGAVSYTHLDVYKRQQSP